MTWLLRGLLFVSLAFIGAVAAGTAGGLFFIPRDAGLAGGAMVLAWALGGAVVVSATGLFLSRRLDTTALRTVCMICGAVAVMLAGVVALRSRTARDRHRDPDHLYAGIPAFTLSLRQIKITDPVLSTRTDLDARRREWATVLPDSRTCRGEMPAAYQRQVAEALLAVAALDMDALTVCRQSEAEAEQSIHWTLPDQMPREIRISPACRAANPEIATLAETVRRAGLVNKSRVRCR